MNPLISYLNAKAEAVFAAQDIPVELAVFTKSDRPDLADFQCNGAFQAAKALRKNPREIASGVQAALQNDPAIEEVSVAGPGFINVRLKNAFIAEQLHSVKFDDLSHTQVEPLTLMLDYGGPNIAKPLHVGHLRSAIIGESIKRIARALGHTVIADVHLGDWGTPMGMLIAELSERHPDWPYFDDAASEFPTDSPIQVDDLTSLYPEAAAHFKADEAFAQKAREMTAELQQGKAGYRALWQHFVNISLVAVKRDFSALNVDFDLWLGESDADAVMQEMIEDLREKGLAVESEGATVIHVQRDEDEIEIPPLILVKSDGGVTYASTDLATIYQRVQSNQPDRIAYVVDQRQSLHFKQVFRAASLAGYIDEQKLEHIGFGTVNGKDGKPFKTREGGVMRLSDLIQLARDEVAHKVGQDEEGECTAEGDIPAMIESIAVAAVKFGDLSSPRVSDYIFDTEAFVRLEGKTGPYIQYAAVRVQSLLDKAREKAVRVDRDVTLQLEQEEERSLALALLDYPAAMQRAFDRRMPSDLCEHVYGVAQAYSRFYQACKILGAEDEGVKLSRLNLSQRVFEHVSACLQHLGIAVPTRMLSLSTNE